VELDRAIGSTLESHNIAIDDAKQGVVVQSR
jgi:hypothetical protein